MNGFGYINDITEFLDKLISNPCNMNKTYFMNLDSLRNDEAQEFPTSQSCVCFRIPGYTLAEWSALIHTETGSNDDAARTVIESLNEIFKNEGVY